MEYVMRDYWDIVWGRRLGEEVNTLEAPHYATMTTVFSFVAAATSGMLGLWPQGSVFMYTTREEKGVTTFHTHLPERALMHSR